LANNENGDPTVLLCKFARWLLCCVIKLVCIHIFLSIFFAVTDGVLKKKKKEANIVKTKFGIIIVLL